MYQQSVERGAKGRRWLLAAQSALCGAAWALASFEPALALPTGGAAQVAPGATLPDISRAEGRITVKLNAPRTAIQWSGYDLAPDELVSYHFDQRSWIVLNRIDSATPARIEGVVEGRVGGAYGGNVWFASRQGLIFGRGVRVDAGGLLAVAGAFDLTGFLDSGQTRFSISDAAPDARIMVLPDGRLTGHGGLVGLAGPSLVTRSGALVSTTGDVLYGAAQTFEIRLAPGVGGDFDLVDFVVPSAALGTGDNVAADLAGETRANAVFLAAVNRSALTSAVVNLEGMVTATRARADGGDVVLSGGGGIEGRQPAQFLPGAGAVDVHLNQTFADRDVTIETIGRIVARPWLRPAEEALDPPALIDDEPPPPLEGEDEEPCEYYYCEGGDEGYEEGGQNEDDDFGFILSDAASALRLYDNDAVALTITGGHARLVARDEASVGRVISGGDVTVAGRRVAANTLAAAGALQLEATDTDIVVAEIDGGGGTLRARRDVLLSALSAQDALGVEAGRDIQIGDGLSEAKGLIRLVAGRDISAELAAATFAEAIASENVALRVGTLRAGVVSGGEVHAEGGQVRIDEVTSAGDIYVRALSGEARVDRATAGDDVYVLATHGDAVLGSARGTGLAPDTVGLSFSGNPDRAGNGRVVQVDSSDLDARLGLAGTGAVERAVTRVNVQAGRDAQVELAGETAGALQIQAMRDASLTAPTARLEAVNAGRDVTLTSLSGGFSASGDLAAGRRMTVRVAGDGTFAGLKAGGDLELETAGQLRLGSAQGANVTLTASDLQAEGDVVGALIVIASRAGALEVGGSEPTTQALHLSAAEFGRLGASSEVRLSAGASLDGPQRDLLLRDLAIDPSRTPSVVFRVGAGAVARVVGRVVPTSDGGSLRIGDATELGWRPQRIEVTGSLGDALFADGAYTQIKGFTEVKLAARKDILVGPSRFIDLVRDLPASDVNVQGGKPAGVAPLGDEAYRIYIATQRLAVSADEKVIQQNTAPDGSSGLLFTRPAQAVLTIDPPKTVELFGVNFDSDGRLAMGPDAARNLSAMVVDAAGQPIATPPGARYRFNTCDLNSGFCLGPGVSDEPKGLPQETGVVLSNGGTLAAFDLTSGGNLSARTPVDESAVSGQGLTTSAPLLEIRPAETDTPETDLVVTGTGSEEIWRKRRRSREP